MGPRVAVVGVFALLAAALAALAWKLPSPEELTKALEQAAVAAARESARGAPARAAGAPGSPPVPAGNAAAAGESSFAGLFTSDDVEAAKAGRRVLYQFTDASGNVHYVKSLEAVPPRLRDRAGRVEVGGSPTPARRARTFSPPKQRPFAYTPPPTVVAYTAPWCGWCRKTLAHLEREGIRYTNKDIDADPRNRQELIRKSGRTSIPVVEIEGELVRGYDPERIDALVAAAS